LKSSASLPHEDSAAKAAQLAARLDPLPASRAMWTIVALEQLNESVAE
jgi:hypothetical protein